MLAYHRGQKLSECAVEVLDKALPKWNVGRIGKRKRERNPLACRLHGMTCLRFRVGVGLLSTGSPTWSWRPRRVIIRMAGFFCPWYPRLPGGRVTALRA